MPNNENPPHAKRHSLPKRHAERPGVPKNQKKKTKFEMTVGKDVIQLVSSSMYTEPLMVYREYIQNATDSIDEAVATGALATSDEGRISIDFDQKERKVWIRDNGVGISNKSFPKTMLSIGASRKRGQKFRGFRGIGRLAGLGYARQVTFRSRQEKDRHTMEVTWDTQAINDAIQDSGDEVDLFEVVRSATEFLKTESDEHTKRFFEVELSGVRRFGADTLMNEGTVTDFVSQVCPCPFSEKFFWKKEVESSLKLIGKRGRSYCIFVDGNQNPVFRPFQNTIEMSRAKKSNITAIEPIEIRDVANELAAVGWVAHHEYLGAIPLQANVRGLRARVGNIQVGDEKIFSHMFPEDRFCSWSVGEIHFVDRRIVPNARRDNFEAGLAFDDAQNQIRQVAARIASRCRLSSRARNRIRRFDSAEEEALAILDSLKMGLGVDDIEFSSVEELEKLRDEMWDIANERRMDEETGDQLLQRVRSIEKRATRIKSKMETKASPRPLRTISEKKRKIYLEVFGHVLACSANRSSGTALIREILRRIERDASRG